jgi:four helix bundle protein
MAPIRRFEHLDAWKKSRDACREVFELTRRGVLSRDIEMKGQLRRAALSMPANVAEGFGRRGTNREFRRFLSIACGSAHEVASLLQIAKELNLVSSEEGSSAINATKRAAACITGLIRYLKSTEVPDCSRPSV